MFWDKCVSILPFLKSECDGHVTFLSMLMHSEFLSIPKYSLPNFRYMEDKFRE